MSEASVGKDTMTGHWEIMGLNIMQPFKVYPDGFPDELVKEIEAMTGRKVVANRPAYKLLMSGASIKWRQGI